MSFKTILVALTEPDQAERLLKVACMLAQRYNAHLVALHPLQDIEVYAGIGVDLPHSAALIFNEEQTNRAERVKEAFEKHTNGEDFVSEWRLARSHSIQPSELIVEHAQCADLVILPQGNLESSMRDANEIIRQVVKTGGRPVLVVPAVGEFETIGRHAMIGWSATCEASRAVSDAVPFMSGNKATLLWVSENKKNAAYLETTAHQMAMCLDRHGVDCTVNHWQNAQIAIGDVLLNESYELGCDLIVTGAFGHSQVYDFVIGATTSHLLEHMTLPVLFSH